MDTVATREARRCGQIMSPREEERGDNEELEQPLPHALRGLLERSSELINVNP